MAKEEGAGKPAILTAENLKKFLLVNLGVFLLTTGVYFFKLPNNFSTGGVSGISILLGNFVPISTASLMAVINVALLVVGYIFIGREFGFWTTYCSLMYSLETWILEKAYPMTAPFTDQPLLELVFAMMLPGLGSALLFYCNASSGGTDIVAMILKKYTSISDIGKALFASDSVIALAACFLFGVETGMFSILGLFLKAFVVDSVIESINLCKFFSIVTSKPTEICDFIIKDLHHSSTVVDGEGAFSHQDKKVVLTAVRRGEAIRLRQRCKQIDPHCFMFITNTSEIIGKGFTSV
ncbi:MAG TPA: YitT family protein [Candidatus Acutalibacter pullistercoris]|uniref:YitT family protein n=1 Tax=Candidatus Acutalibacter pullistercoris TaxID=2838418 RepID=A0A9D1YDC4_9FIRM|nr:YitT family protein [Candidatus Acutalibacter pullistercoris]